MHALDLYALDLQQSQPLTREQEQTATRDQLVTANLRFAYSIAGQYRGRGIDFDDLVQLANLGLCHAAATFDPSRGFKFITFAVWQIRQAILKTLEDCELIHLPANQYADGHRLRFESLDVPLNESRGDGLARVDIVPDEGPPPDVAIEENESVCFVESQLNRLPEQDRLILVRYFGLDGETFTLDEIGQQMGITRERVRQLKERAIARLWMGSFQGRQLEFAN
jgi:RNA polymerase primary sigma factor